MGIKFYRSHNKAKKIRKRLNYTRTWFSTHKWVACKHNIIIFRPCSPSDGPWTSIQRRISQIEYWTIVPSRPQAIRFDFPSTLRHPKTRCCLRLQKISSPRQLRFQRQFDECLLGNFSNQLQVKLQSFPWLSQKMLRQQLDQEPRSHMPALHPRIIQKLLHSIMISI